jgi:ParD-like antitoxin of type II bacterial toxin-antitoxin system
MGQPVKLSDELVNDARAVVPFSQRSIAGQIEFWAGLGKSIEPLLRGDQALSLQMAGGERPLSVLLAEVDTAKGRERLEDVLNKCPYPRFKPVVGHPELICRIEEDGRETIGRFVGREFLAVEVEVDR